MDWRQLETMVDETMVAAFGESVRLSFLKNGAADPAHPLRDIRAILHTGGDDSQPVGGGGDWRSRLSAGAAELFIEGSTYTGPSIVVGDKVRGNDRDGQPWWKVEAVSDRYSSLIVLTLSQA